MLTAELSAAVAESCSCASMWSKPLLGVRRCGWLPVLLQVDPHVLHPTAPTAAPTSPVVCLRGLLLLLPSAVGMWRKCGTLLAKAAVASNGRVLKYDPLAGHAIRGPQQNRPAATASTQLKKGEERRWQEEEAGKERRQGKAAPETQLRTPPKHKFRSLRLAARSGGHRGCWWL